MLFIKRAFSILLSVIVAVGSYLFGFFPAVKKFRIIVPENWEMDVGDSRTLDYVFPDGETDRVLSWSSKPSETAAVDEWGRVTALGVGEAVITAVCADGSKGSATLRVVASPTKTGCRRRTVNYSREGTEQVNNLQKIVTRYKHGNKEIPEYVSSIKDYSKHRKAVTADGAEWIITDYGVLRTLNSAPTQRDVEQRFMGDRYFYSADTTDGKVFAIFPDGRNGIWTVMSEGVTHIEMVEMDGESKAELMSFDTRKDVSRRGMTSEAMYYSGKWNGMESDNDGLWTSMFGAGELMRYAVLRNDSTASQEQIAQARESAMLSAEAVLMLHYISMRSGTTQAYVRSQRDCGINATINERRLSYEALEAGGDCSVNVPSRSPAAQFKVANGLLTLSGSTKLLMPADSLAFLSPDNWSDPGDPANSGVSYARRTKLLEGFVARTYSFKNEGFGTYGNIYWSVNSDRTATGVSAISPSSSSYYINGENLRGAKVDASVQVPQRLWNDLIGAGYTAADIIYKGDTSADELVGHMFIFKLIFDILAPEDEEIKALTVNAIDALAQHLVDNGYVLVDGTGQPTTWSKFNRECFFSSSNIAMAPLHAAVLLSIFKTAAYITGDRKWEDEYRLAALDPAYEYAEVSAQYYERYKSVIAASAGEMLSPAISVAINAYNGNLVDTIFRLSLNYSDEEMAMLAFYTLFQMETDKKLLSFYRNAIDQWWISAQYSENPLWYYIYQLAYPNTKVKDAYGNRAIETAAWTLSRHPVDTVDYLASNEKRDDIATLDLSEIGFNLVDTLTYSLVSKNQLAYTSYSSDFANTVAFVLSVNKLDWTVAAPDERALGKYNQCTYNLTRPYNTDIKESSTTYTLPYWMGRYHGMLK